MFQEHNIEISLLLPFQSAIVKNVKKKEERFDAQRGNVALKNSNRFWSWTRGRAITTQESQLHVAICVITRTS